MPDFRTVKKPEALKGIVIEAEDPNLTGGVDSAVGLDTEAGEPDAQLDIRYRNGNTYVSLAVDNDKGERVPEEHWKFTGYISPMDCRTNWKAAQQTDA